MAVRPQVAIGKVVISVLSAWARERVNKETLTANLQSFLIPYHF